ncbi:MAG: glycosyltransferase family 9 protein [Bacteriovorax sp.]|jgi:ADP-heptose:LPS heptosyltransferase
MKNILIVNLRRIGDVYTTGHLINSLTKEGNSVSLLVYKESVKAAQNLKNVAHLHVIDRKEIITLKSNKLFSDGFAFEQLFNQLESVKNKKWDMIINYSNDMVAAYICSYLKSTTSKVVGVHYNQTRSIVSGNDWEILFNDVLPVIKYAPVHFTDCYHKMLGLPLNREGEKVITNSAHNASAFSNMNTVRKSLASNEGYSKIVAIQLKTSDVAKDISEETLIQLITLINNHNDYIPVLLIAPFKDEQLYAEEINAQFNNELVVVEADLLAIASVLMNVDILITPDTAIKHIADLTETPVLEVSLGHAPFLKQGSYLAGSLILTDLIVERNFNKSTNVSTQIKAQDIMSSLEYFFSKNKSVRPKLTSNVTLYTCSFDNVGAKYSVAAGTVNTPTEIHRLMSRQLINIIYEGNESPEIYNDVIDFGIQATTAWCSEEKTNVTNVMKDLLGTLRSLLQSQESRKSSKDFVANLGKLMVHAEGTSMVQIPVTMFKAKIELIEAKTFEENAKEVEILLYDLKADIQKVLLCIKNLEDSVLIQKKEEFLNRTSDIDNN